MRDGLDPSAAAKAVSALELAHRDAILNSQLHSFTGMFFGKDPTEVTEGELHSFLRIFVFFPAIFAALAATALALASVTPLKQMPDPIEVDGADILSTYLAPLTSTIEEHVRRVADESVVRAVAAHVRIEPKAPEMPAMPGHEAASVEVAADARAAADSTQSEAAEAKLSDGKPVDSKPAGPMRPTLVSTNTTPGAA